MTYVIQFDGEARRERTNICKAVVDGDLERVQKLIESGINLNQEDYDYETPLSLAIKLSHLEIIKTLVKYGAKPDISSLEIFINEDFCKPEILEILIKAGLDINAKLEEGMTAIMFASQFGNLDIAKKLVEGGTDVNAISHKSSFALLYAADNGDQEMFDFLAPLTSSDLRSIAEKELPSGLIYRERTSNQSVERLIASSALGHLEDVLEVIRNRVDINAIGVEGHTALFIAAHWGYVGIIRTLVQAGANVDLGTEDGETPLMAAAHMTVLSEQQLATSGMNQLEVMRVLIDSGANVNAKTNEGWTALMAAANSGSTEAVQLLIQAGADVNTKDSRGDTPLSRAKEIEHEEIVKILQLSGAMNL